MNETIKNPQRTLNSFDSAYDRVFTNPLFNKQDWEYAAKHGTLMPYVNALDALNGKDAKAIGDKYNLVYADSKTRMSALFNEAGADRTNNQTKRTRELYDASGAPVLNEEGKPKTEEYYASDYEYNLELIRKQNDYNQKAYEFKLADNMKNEISGWSRAVPNILTPVTSFATGIAQAIDNLTAIAGGVIDSITGKVKDDKPLIEGFVESVASNDNRHFSSLISDFAEFEKRYTDLRDISGEYSNWGRYVGGLFTSFGEMIPSWAIGRGTGVLLNNVPKIGINQINTVASVASQGSFYVGMTAGNIQETYHEFVDAGATPDLGILLANSAIKSTLQWGVEYGLGKVLGVTNLDSMVYGKTAAARGSGSLTKRAVSTIFKEAGQEGLEEVLQDTSDFLVDTAFAKYIDKHYAAEPISWQSLMDSFILGAIMSLGGSALDVARTEKFREGDVKYGKFASWQHGIDSKSFINNVVNALDIADRRLKHSNKYSPIELSRAKNAAMEAYSAFRMITSIYEEIGDERFANADRILRDITDDIKAGVFSPTQTRAFVNTMQLQFANLRDMKRKAIDDALKEGNVTEVKETINAEDEIETVESTPETEVAKKVMEDEGADKVIITNGNVATEVEEEDGTVNVIISEDKLKSAGSSTGAIKYEISCDKLVNTVAEEFVDDATYKNITEQYKKYACKDEVTSREVATALLFDMNFFRAVLTTGNKDVYHLLSALLNIEKTVIRGRARNAEYKARITEATNNWIKVLTQYCIDYPDADPGMFLYMVSDKKEAESIRRRIYRERVFLKIKMSILNNQELSKKEKIVVDTRIKNAFTESEATIIKERLASNRIDIRKSGIEAIEHRYNQIYNATYDGITYMEETTMANKLFNLFLKNYNLTLQTLNDSRFLTEQDVAYIKENYGDLIEANIVAFRNEQFSKFTNSKMSYKVNKDGSLLIIDNNEYVGFTNGEPGAYLDKGYGTERTVPIDVSKRNNKLLPLLSDKVSKVLAATLTIDDVITNTQFLSDEVLNDIKKFMYKTYNRKPHVVTPEMAFLYLRSYFLNTYKTLGIVMMSDGTFGFAEMGQMYDVFKNKNKLVINDKTTIQDIFKEEYIPDGLKIQIIDSNEEEAHYSGESMVTVNGTRVAVPDRTIYVSRGFLKSKDDVIRFVLAHEFHHAMQANTRMNGGLITNWLNNVKNSADIIKDVRKHIPQLFKDVEKNSQKERELVQDYGYFATGESQAYGLENNKHLDFYPVYTEKRGNATYLVMPWGSKIPLSFEKKLQEKRAIGKTVQSIATNSEVKTFYSVAGAYGSITPEIAADWKKYDDTINNKNQEFQKLDCVVDYLSTDIGAYIHNKSNKEQLAAALKNTTLQEFGYQRLYSAMAPMMTYDAFKSARIPVMTVLAHDNKNVLTVGVIGKTKNTLFENASKLFNQLNVSTNDAKFAWSMVPVIMIKGYITNDATKLNTVILDTDTNWNEISYTSDTSQFDFSVLDNEEDIVDDYQSYTSESNYERNSNPDLYTNDFKSSQVLDAEYDAAIQYEDADLQDKLVHDAALNWGAIEKDGKAVDFYHGTENAGSDKFNPELGVFKGNWFTTSKVDADSYGGNREGKIYNPDERAYTETIKGGNYKVNDYMQFDSKEDADAFLKKYPNAVNYRTDKELLDLKEDAMSYEEESTYYAELMDKDRAKMQEDYSIYEENHSRIATVQEFLNNPNAFSKSDIIRMFDSIDTENDIRAYLDAGYTNEDIVQLLNDTENDGTIMDANFLARVKPNEEGEVYRTVNRRTYHVFVKLNNPCVIDLHGDKIIGNYDVVEKAMKNKAYDGVLLKNVKVGAYGNIGDVAIIKNSDSVRLANYTIYDANGDIVPLSKRFDLQRTDVQSADFKVDVLKNIERDDEYFDAINKKDTTKLNTLVKNAASQAGFDSPKLYHGTKNFGFTKTDLNYAADETSFFTTDSMKLASTYSGKTGERKLSDSGLSEEYMNAKTNLDMAQSNLNIAIKNLFKNDVSLAKSTTDKLDGILSSIRDRLSNSDIEYIIDKCYWLLNDSMMTAFSKQYNGEIDWKIKNSAFNDFKYKEGNQVNKALDKLVPAIKKLAKTDKSVGNYAFYGNTDNMLTIDAEGSAWNKIKKSSIEEKVRKHINESKINTRDLAYYAGQEGYDGVIIKNVYDDGGQGYDRQSQPSNLYIYTNPEGKLKSADNIVYDSFGNIVPLSQRFNPNHPDFRSADFNFKTLDRKYDKNGMPLPNKNEITEEEARKRGFMTSTEKPNAKYDVRYIVLNPDGTQQLTYGTPQHPIYHYLKKKQKYKSRYVSVKKYKGTPLEPFLKRKQVSPKIKDFVLNSSGDYDSYIQEKIDNGTLTEKDIYDFLRERESISEKTFQAINDAFFHNENIHTLKELQDSIVHTMRESWALYELFNNKNLAKNPIILANKDKLTDPNISPDELLDIISVDEKLFKLYNLKYNSFFVQSKSYSDNEFSEGYARILYMKNYDGTIKSERDAANMARVAALLRQDEPSSGGAVSMDEVTEREKLVREMLDSVEYERDEIITQLANGAYFDAALEAHEKGATADEAIYAGEVAKSKLQYMLLHMNKTEFDDYVRTHKDIGNELINGMMTEITGEGMRLKGEYKVDMTPGYLMNRIRGAIRTIKRNLAPNDRKQLAKKYPNLFDKDGDIKREVYSNKIPNKTRSGFHFSLKSVDELTDIFAKLNEVKKEVKEKRRAEHNAKKAGEILRKAAKNTGKKAKTETKTKDGKKRRHYATFEIENEVITIHSARPIPAKIKEFLKMEFTRSAPTTVKNLSQQDERHLKMYGKNFYDQHSKGLDELTTSEVLEILEFYKYSGVPLEDVTAGYLSVAIWTLEYIVEATRFGTGKFVIDEGSLHTAETLLKNLVSLTGTALAVWRAAWKRLNPVKEVQSNIVRMSGLSIEDEDVEAFLKAVQTGDPTKVNDAKAEFEQKIIEKQKAYNALRPKMERLLDNFMAWERLAMLSGPGTWVRNKASNWVIGSVGHLSDKMNGKLNNTLLHMFQPINNKVLNSWAKDVSTKIDVLNVDLSLDTIRAYLDAKASHDDISLENVKHIINSTIANEAMANRVYSILDSSPTPKGYISAGANFEHQYTIAGTKTDEHVQKYINKYLIDNGLLDESLSSLNKYDPRVKRNNDNITSATVLTDLLANAVIWRVNSNKLFTGNPNEPGKLTNKVIKKGITTNNAAIKKVGSMMQVISKAARKGLKGSENFIRKAISDDRSVKKWTIIYLGKMITEDLKSGVIEDVESFFTKDSVSTQFLTYVAEAFKFASNDFIHKPNLIYDFESWLAKKSYPAYFVYKQLFPFAGASWNWFVEGLKYSPAGLGNAIIRFAKLENTIGKMDENRRMFKHNDTGVSSSFAKYMTLRDINKGIIGSIGWIIGALLRAFGLARIDKNDDKYKLYLGTEGAGVKIDISQIFGTQGIFMGMATVGAFDDAYEFGDILLATFNQMSTDFIGTDVFNSMRYYKQPSDWLLNQPYQIASMAIPNFLKTLTAMTSTGKRRYDNDFLGKVQRLCEQAIPLLSLFNPATRLDPFTGENQTTCKYWWLDSVLTTTTKLTPLNIKPYRVSEMERLELAYGYHKIELTGRYLVNGNKVKLDADDVHNVNVKYADLNTKAFKILESDVGTHKIEQADGSYKYKRWSQMTGEEKAAIVNRTMNHNSDYAKIYILTSTGRYRYYASDKEYVNLRALGITKNVYRSTNKVKGFVKIN